MGIDIGENSAFLKQEKNKKPIVHLVIFLCFLISALSSNTTLVCLFILLGLISALLGKVNPYTLLVIAVPFTVTLNNPITLTASISDVVLPWTLIFALRYSWPLKKEILCKYKKGFWWAIALLLVILVSSFGNEIQLSGYFSSLAKIIFALIFALISILYFYENRQKIENIWKIAKVWIYVSAAVSGLGILGYILLLAGIHTDLMYESARLQSVFDNPNSFAAYGAVSLGIAAAYSVGNRKPLLNWFSVIIMIALVLSNSRAATIAVTVYVLLGFLLFLKSKILLKKWIMYGLALITLCFLLMPTVNGVFELITPTRAVPGLITPTSGPSNTSVTEIEASSGPKPTSSPSKTARAGEVKNPVTQRESITEDSRMTIWKTALQLWKDHPIQGVGFGQFYYLSKSSLGTAYVVHNSFLSFLTETGIIGFLVFIAGFISVSFNLLKTKKNVNKILFITLMSLSVMMLSNNLENTRYFWLLFGVCFSAPLTLKQTEETQ